MILMLSGLLLYGWFETYLTSVLLLDPSFNMTMSFVTTDSTSTVYKRVSRTKVQCTRTFPNATNDEEVSSQINPIYSVDVPVKL